MDDNQEVLFFKDLEGKIPATKVGDRVALVKGCVKGCVLGRLSQPNLAYRPTLRFDESGAPYLSFGDDEYATDWIATSGNQE